MVLWNPVEKLEKLKLSASQRYFLPAKMSEGWKMFYYLQYTAVYNMKIVKTEKETKGHFDKESVWVCWSDFNNTVFHKKFLCRNKQGFMKIYVSNY